MKAQYFGDVNDYRKFALLRLLAEVGGFKIGVCWMLTEGDESGQGSQRGYLEQPETWRVYDHEVFDALAAVPAKPILADLRRVEAEGLIPGAEFFEAIVPDAKTEREAWATNCLGNFSDVNLAFFDPDNGLEIAARPRGRKNSNKYAFVDELAAHYAAGRSILVYQHFPRHISRAEVLARARDRLDVAMPEAATISLRTPFAAFILASRPEHSSRIEDSLVEIKRRCWHLRFFDICASPFDRAQ